MSDVKKGDIFETAKTLKSKVLGEYETHLISLLEVQRSQVPLIQESSGLEISPEAFGRVLQGLEDLDLHNRFSRVFEEKNGLISAVASDIFPLDENGFTKTSQLALRFGEIDSKDFRVMFDPAVSIQDFEKSSHVIPISYICDYLAQGDEKSVDFKKLSPEQSLQESVKSLEYFSKNLTLERQDAVEISAALLVLRSAKKGQEKSLLKPVARTLEKFALKNVKDLESSGRFSVNGLYLSLTAMTLSRSLTRSSALYEKDLLKTYESERQNTAKELRSSDLSKSPVIFEKTDSSLKRSAPKKRDSGLER